jgi:hypothetical protein
MTRPARSSHRLVGVRPFRWPEHQQGDRGGGHPEGDHEAEAPVGDRDDRGVAAGTVLGGVLGLQVVDAVHGAVEFAGAEVRQQVRDLEGEQFPAAVEAADGEDGERGRALGLVQALGGGHLHRLHLVMILPGCRR